MLLNSPLFLSEGRRLRHKLDRCLDEFPQWLEWDGICIENSHRPLGADMSALLEDGLVLRFFEEPEASSGDPERAATYRRVPWFLIMEWVKPQ